MGPPDSLPLDGNSNLLLDPNSSTGPGQKADTGLMEEQYGPCFYFKYLNWLSLYSNPREYATINLGPEEIDKYRRGG